MTRFFVILLAAIASPTFVFSQQILTLDKAVVEGMNFFSKKFPPNTIVAVLKIEAPGDDLAKHITAECEKYISASTRLSSVNKKGLTAILKQINISNLNKADDDDVLNVARMLGADVVIFGEFSKRGDNYKLFIQALDAETGDIKAIQSLKVGLDEILSGFIGEKNAAPVSHKEMNKNDLANVKKEMEEIKSMLTARQALQRQFISNNTPDMSEKRIKVSVVGSEGIGADEQIVIIDAEKATSYNFMDIYIDREFAMRIPRKTVAPLVLKKGTHTLTIAQIEDYEGIAQTERFYGIGRVLKKKDVSFTLWDYAVKLGIRTTRRRLDGIEVERESAPQNYLRKYKVLRVSPDVNTSRSHNTVRRLSRLDTAFSAFDAKKAGEDDSVLARLENETVEKQDYADTQIPGYVLSVERKKVEDDKYFVFSSRCELRNLGLDDLGIDMEFGTIRKSGFYLSADFSVDLLGLLKENSGYFGGGLNFGGCFNKDGAVKNVFGFTAGLWGGGSASYDYNYSFGGVFWKLMFGRNGNFDITNKALFGSDYGFSQFNINHSLSAGFTLTKKRGTYR